MKFLQSLWVALGLLAQNLGQRYKEYQTSDLPMANLMVELFPALKKRLEEL